MFVLGALLGFVIYFSVGAITLRFALTLVANYSPTILTCVWYQFILIFIWLIISTASTTVVSTISLDSTIVSFLNYLIVILISSLVLGRIVADSENGKLGFLKALLVLIIKSFVTFITCFLPVVFGIAMFSLKYA